MRRRRADLEVGHLYIPGNNAILRMISTAANVLLTGLGQFHFEALGRD